jgi:hypothetical protein
MEKMRLIQGRALKPLVFHILLLTSVVSIALPHAVASYSSEKTYYDSADATPNSGGIGAHEARAKAFRNGTMWLETASGAWAWADAYGWVTWDFQPPYTLYNVKVSADFTAFGYVGTWFSSAHLWFTLEVGGKSDEYYKFYGNYWHGEISPSETLSIDFGTMNSGTTYTIKATIRIHCENTAFVDLESNGPPPLGSGGINREGYGRVLRMVVEAP